MAYTVPVFNLTCDIYALAAPPPVGPPIYLAVPCQNYVFSRWHPNHQIQHSFRFPVGAFAGISGEILGVTQYWIECPIGSAHFYMVVSVAVMHEGFPNSYWAAECYEIDPATLPASFLGSFLP